MSTGNDEIDLQLIRLIHDYQDAVRQAGELATGGKYFIHGFASEVELAKLDYER